MAKKARKEIKESTGEEKVMSKMHQKTELYKSYYYCCFISAVIAMCSFGK